MIALHKIKGRSSHYGNDRADTKAAKGVLTLTPLGRHALALPVLRPTAPPALTHFTTLTLAEQSQHLQDTMQAAATLIFGKPYLTHPSIRMIHRMQSENLTPDQRHKLRRAVKHRIVKDIIYFFLKKKNSGSAHSSKKTLILLLHSNGRP